MATTSFGDGSASLEPNAIQKLYTMEPVPGKGQGLIAAQHIPRGTRILCEKPLFTIPHYRSNRQFQDIHLLVADKLKRLAKDEQRAFLSLHNNFRGTNNPFTGIIRTNALPLGPGALDGGIFLEISRINHACLPNSQNTWNSTREQETIHAVRDIAKGEEITIMYAGGPFESRQRDLKDAFGIDCTCHLCSLPERERAVSDKRFMEILRLDALIGSESHLISNPEKCLHGAHAMLMLMEAENITDARIPRLYYDAFQIAAAHGDQTRAKVFAERAYEARVCCEGEDSPSAIRMKGFAANPATHGSFGLTNRWRQSENMTTRALEGEMFEAWLWRRIFF
ncbi:MAG: hypothetical protein M1813_002971 [Trichoglossum hirsutum]|nr:MAG: hypothetical protein M1813_002971 [Trichoglossum hirsutum]